MQDGQMEYVIELLRRRSGMVISSEQAYLVDNRLSGLAREEGHGSVEELLGHARIVPDCEIHERIVEAMTINETLFFRDRVPFDYMRQTVFPRLALGGGGAINIWCAACSSGQEPYSIAMLLDQEPHLVGDRQVNIIATDVSKGILRRAKEGLFSQFEVQRGLPVRLLMQYFVEEDDHWRISSGIRSRVRFMQHNLLQSATGLGRFDIVFCRNVLIYFDMKMKSEVLGRVSEAMVPGGYLFLGAAERAGSGTEFSETDARRGIFRRSGEDQRTEAA